MAPKTIVRRETKAGRRMERGRVGKLKDVVIGSTMIKRYEKAVTRFLRWTDREPRGDIVDVEGLDEELCLFLEGLWEDGDPKSWGADALSG